MTKTYLTMCIVLLCTICSAQPFLTGAYLESGANNIRSVKTKLPAGRYFTKICKLRRRMEFKSLNKLVGGFMKLIPLLIMCMLVSVNLFAQIDSTFVRYYSPTYETHPFWYSFPISGIYAANVFENYDGNFVLQALATYHSPPPVWVCPQSPMMFYTRNGFYQSTMFGPQFEGGIDVGYYSRIVKDGLGGYLALDMFEHKIHRLDNDLQYVGAVQLFIDNGILENVWDLIEDNNGFIVVSGYPIYNVSKFSFDLTNLWYKPLIAHEHVRIRKLSDGSYVNMWWYSPHFKVMKISSMGDTIWTKQLQITGVDNFVEVNNRFYGFAYWSININTAELRVYDFGIDFENEEPGDPILVIPTYPLLDSNLYGLGEPFSVIKTSDNCIIIAVSTPSGEIFKFDNDFNLLWSSNALQNESVGIGNHPLIELGNGDLLYCATVGYQPRQLALVRIDSNGNFVGIDDETEQTPPIRCISAYPNPFSQKITLSTNKRLLHPSKFTIYNIKGQQVESIDLNDKAVTWVPKDIPSGLYIVKLVEGSKTIESHLISYIE